MAAYKKLNSGFLPFVQKTEETSPYTDIANRAKVDASLKTIFGVERIHINSINLLPKEQGPNGERVFESDSGDSRVRLVGLWSTLFSNDGQVVESTASTTGNYIEVTFYGTGLNVLHYADTNDRAMTVSIDGGGSSVINNIQSGILAGRNTKSFINKNITSGLSLGWHTVKIEAASGASTNLRLYGLEILNEASQITIKAGKAHGNGYEYDIVSDQLVDYKLGFDNILDANVGTRGGRVITYIDPADGLVKKRLTKVNAAQANLTSADHTNEAEYRIVNFREFGRNRADDFSTLASVVSDRAFTLDDGTTTLVGNDVRGQVLTAGIDALFGDTTGSFFTLTFVGTGLDIYSVGQATGTYDAHTVSVDNVSIGTIAGSSVGEYIKIVSGLPYGTHTVKFNRDAAVGNGLHISDFIVYQSKKPVLPESAVKISDYNIMADYDSSSTANKLSVAPGVLKKFGTRENIYSGTWTALGLDVTNFLSGWTVSCNNATTYTEYSFFGTGFEFGGFTISGNAQDWTVDVDGSSDLSGFTTASAFTSTGLTFTDSTGTVTGTAGGSNGPCKVKVSGLALGFHTIRITKNNGTTSFYVDFFDNITPIHSPHTTFGSLAVKDIRNFDSMKDINNKPKEKESFVIYDLPSTVVQKSKNISQILRIQAGHVHVYFEEIMSDEYYIWSGGAISDAVLSNNGIKQKNALYVSYYSSAGTSSDQNKNSINVLGKLEKDELEE